MIIDYFIDYWLFDDRFIIIDRIHIITYDNRIDLELYNIGYYNNQFKPPILDWGLEIVLEENMVA